MSKEYSVTLGSGLTDHSALAPAYNFANGTFPVPSQRDALKVHVGDGIVLLNPENGSVSIGIKSQAVTVVATATPLPASALEYRRSLSIYNNSSVVIYLGYSDVTTSTGFPLAAGQSISIDCQQTPGMTVYAICGSSANVRILELA